MIIPIDYKAAKVRRSQQYFNRLTLPFYDLVLYGFVSRFIWGVPIERLDAHYQRYTRSNHLEVGVGTGYLLDRAEFPSEPRRLALMDLSEACLERTARRVARYQPETYVQDLLSPIAHRPAPFDSISLNYVMHCVPGNFREKHIALQNLATLLGPHGVLFGTTVLGMDVKRNVLSRLAMGALNTIGLFNNRHDSARDLAGFLRKHFHVLEFHVEGVVAFFAVTCKGNGN